MGTDSDHVKVWFACNEHDRDTFTPVEDGNDINPNSQDHNFLLAFRSVLSTDAFYEGVSATLARKIKSTRRRNAKEANRQIGKLKKATETRSNIEHHLKHWQAAYKEGYKSEAQHAYGQVGLPIQRPEPTSR